MKLTEKQFHVLRTISYCNCFNYQSFSREEQAACNWLHKNGYVGWFKEDLGGPEKVPTQLWLSDKGKEYLEEWKKEQAQIKSEQARNRREIIGIILAACTLIVGIAAILLR